MSFKLESAAFKDGETIPVKYTCKGEDISPALNWEGAPDGTRTFALICDDPDAPMGTWVHWVIYNIPSQRSGLPENVRKDQDVLSGELEGVLQGVNSWRRLGYGGPCPPPGPPHRYFFKLYALDTTITTPGLDKDGLLKAMQGHILGEAQIMGTFQR